MTLFPQSQFGFVCGKPSGVAPWFLRSLEPGYFAQVGDHRIFRLRTGRNGIGPAVVKASERTSFDPTVDACFLESFHGGGLRVGHAGFHSAFRKYPTAAAGLYQQEFDATFSKSVADGCHLLAWLELSGARGKTASSLLTHRFSGLSSRVLDERLVWLDHILVPAGPDPMPVEITVRQNLFAYLFGNLHIRESRER
jgi:hypothetical protein